MVGTTNNASNTSQNVSATTAPHDATDDQHSATAHSKATGFSETASIIAGGIEEDTPDVKHELASPPPMSPNRPDNTESFDCVIQPSIEMNEESLADIEYIIQSDLSSFGSLSGSPTPQAEDQLYPPSPEGASLSAKTQLRESPSVITAGDEQEETSEGPLGDEQACSDPEGNNKHTKVAEAADNQKGVSSPADQRCENCDRDFTGKSIKCLAGHLRWCKTKTQKETSEEAALSPVLTSINGLNPTGPAMETPSKETAYNCSVR